MYLKTYFKLGNSGEKFTTLVNAKPKFEVSHDGGDKYTITRITPVNQIVFTFNLGEAVTADPLGAGQPAQVTIRQFLNNFTEYPLCKVFKILWCNNFKTPFLNKK